MKAVLYEEFKQRPRLTEVSFPKPSAGGVVLQVKATGICRSDWHGWMGNDSDVKLPHVPGHELAGIVSEVGSDVKLWKTGERVTLPFVGGCGRCPQCATGNQQICDFQFQPGFTHWGSFAEYVAIDYADANLVRLPDEMDFISAASLGCRFVTSFRALVDQGRVMSGEWVAVHGCGGVGLSAIMIASALGANVIAVDISEDKLAFAKKLGACAVVNSSIDSNVTEAVMEISGGGVHISIDALGSPQTCRNSITNLRKRGRHIQVGILEAEDIETQIPMNTIMSRELEIYGSHGMQAHRYPAIFDLIAKGKLHPENLIGKIISLEDSIDELVNMNSFSGTGVTVIELN